jgi:ankyrin repeat protein
LDRQNASALHYATRFNSIDCVCLLVEHRASIDQQDACGNTPLHCLALCQKNGNHDSIVDILLQRAKEFRLLSNLQNYVDMKNNDQQTALSLACEHGHTRLVHILLDYQADIHYYLSLHMAIKGEHLNIVQILLARQTPSISMNNAAESSWHIACRYNRTDILQTLIHHCGDQLDFEVRDQQGLTPLLTAGTFNHRYCIEILLHYGADRRARDYRGRNLCP